MPCTYTHHIFAKDVLKACNSDVKNRIVNNENTFYVFAQSFDIAFFKNYSFGHYAHTHNSNLYFTNIIKYIRDNDLCDNSQVMAYLYGSVCHYVLDTIVHPYVFYKTGNFYYKNKKTKKYKGHHNYLEYMIDAIIYEERTNKNIYKANLSNIMLPKIEFSKELSNTIDYACLNAFERNNAIKLFRIGLKNFRFIVSHGFQSRFGIKYFIYKILDKINFSKKRKLSNMCYYIKKLDYSVLNVEHKKWNYPVDKKMSFHYSFYDLYDVAVERARYLINNLDNVIDKDEKQVKKALKEIGNLSYTTGKNVDNKSTMKYFEY